MIRLSGIIEIGNTICYKYSTIKLLQEDGYKVDLLLRFIEFTESYGLKVNVRYWLTDVPTSFDDAQTGFLKSLYGVVNADCCATEYNYSEWTAGMDYDSELNVGGHDLLEELQGHEGKYLLIEIVSTDILKPGEINYE